MAEAAARTESGIEAVSVLVETPLMRVARLTLAPRVESAVAPKMAHTVRNLGNGRASSVVIQSGGAYDLHFVGKP